MDKNKPDNVIFEIRRHPFGLITLYLYSIIGVGVGVALIVFGANNSFDLSGSQRSLLILVMGVFLALTILFLLLASKIYWASKLTLTDKEIKQVIQHSLFNRSKSRLNLANVEDVTTSQKGIFSSMMNFGRLDIETAGEQANFKFKYCPHPDRCARLVMEARQEYLDNNPQNRQSIR